MCISKLCLKWGVSNTKCEEMHNNFAFAGESDYFVPVIIRRAKGEIKANTLKVTVISSKMMIMCVLLLFSDICQNKILGEN